jgi:hypothetical protein
MVAPGAVCGDDEYLIEREILLGPFRVMTRLKHKVLLFGRTSNAYSIDFILTPYVAGTAAFASAKGWLKSNTVNDWLKNSPKQRRESAGLLLRHAARREQPIIPATLSRFLLRLLI